MKCSRSHRDDSTGGGRRPARNRWAALAVGIGFLVATACGGPGEEEAAPAATAEATQMDAFFANLAAHCGQAYPGSLTLEPPGDDMLEGDELLVVHFRACTEDELQLPFHIEQMDGEWDRSRTWIYRKTDDGRLELRHDHRMPDGTEDEVTWYGAWTIAEGSPERQEFIIEDREYEDGLERGWRVEIEPDVRYTYGTTRGGEWSWRVDFDLSEPLDLDDVPPPPWGYEDGRGPLR